MAGHDFSLFLTFLYFSGDEQIRKTKIRWPCSWKERIADLLLCRGKWYDRDILLIDKRNPTT